MPRSKKSKLQSREKRRQARGDAQRAQTTAAEEKGATPPSSPPAEGSPQRSSAASIPQELQSELPTTTAAVGASCTRGAEGVQGQDGASATSSEARTLGSQRDPLSMRVKLLLQFLLHKYKLNQRISKVGMIKIINRRYKERFPEILQRASEHIELLFGLEVKAVDAKAQVYVVVSKLEPSREENQSRSRELPKYGLLLPLLGMIYLNNHKAGEEEVWDFLRSLGIYDGKRHFIFGNPRKLITEDWVQEKYLEYRQVASSDPPSYEFLWGPKAHAEDTKNKVLKFLSKIHDKTPTAFQSLLEDLVS